MNESRLMITGVSAICSLGSGRQAIVEGLRREADGFSSRPAPAWMSGRVSQAGKPVPPSTMTAAWAPDFKPSPAIPPMKARRMDRSAQMTIVAARAALDQAGWDVAREGPAALGIFIGSGFCGTHSALSSVRTVCAQGAEEASAAAFPNTVPNAPAGQLAIFFGIEGPSATLLQTGTTADGALDCAREQLALGQCRAALWGGVDELSEYLWFGWRRLGWVGDPSPDRPYGRPLDPQSRGFVAGEAAAVLLVELEAGARLRNTRPPAAIEYAATAAVEALPWAYPDGDQVERAAAFLAAAVDAAGIPDLVLGCANGHPRLDRFETDVLARVIGDRAPVWFPKGQVGEGMASTALRATLAVWLIEEGFVPANFWLRPNPPVSSLTVPVESLERPINRVLIPTVSAGGTLGAVVIGRV